MPTRAHARCDNGIRTPGAQEEHAVPARILDWRRTVFGCSVFCSLIMRAVRLIGFTTLLNDAVNEQKIRCLFAKEVCIMEVVPSSYKWMQANLTLHHAPVHWQIHPSMEGSTGLRATCIVSNCIQNVALLNQFTIVVSHTYTHWCGVLLDQKCISVHLITQALGRATLDDMYKLYKKLGLCW